MGTVVFAYRLCFYCVEIPLYKLEDLPGCAVLMGSVGGHIGCKGTAFFSYMQMFCVFFRCPCAPPRTRTAHVLLAGLLR